MNMTKDELLKEMEHVLETQGEQALEKFTLEHFTELPEDVQGKVLLGYYSQAIEKEAGEAAIAELQKEGLEALEELEAIKAEASKSE
jgi:hypothetical protein